MRYFDYAKRRSKLLIAQVWEELYGVNGLTRYAKTIYKDNWEDVLQASFVHIINHFDIKKSTDLHNYCIRVVKTIYMGKYKDESPDDLHLQIASDENSFKSFEELNDYDKVDKNLTIDKGTVEECKEYLLPRFIKDADFFNTLNPKDRVFDYNDLSEMFSDKVIAGAIMELQDIYGNAIQELKENNKKYKRVFRSYTPDRYKENFDKTVELECIIDDVVLYKSTTSKSSRRQHVYMINIKTMVSRLMSRLENELCRKVNDVTIWVTLSGFMSTDINAIRAQFEQEVICRFLTTCDFLKILAYEKGNRLYLTSVDEVPSYIYVDIKDLKFGINFQSVISKEV